MRRSQLGLLRCARRAPGAVAAIAMALAALAMDGGAARAQTTGFTIVGHIEDFILDEPLDRLSSATLRVRGIPIVLPRNLLVTLPGRYMTPQDMFRGPRGGAVQAPSGLALADPTPPRIPFEAEVTGNVSAGRYVAGVVRISQGALHLGAGYIQAIDPATGELRVGDRGGAAGARVRLNDPTGIYGVANGSGAKAALPLDHRFALDPDNAPVHARTGFPVCIPHPGASEECPAGNRPPGNPMRFTCARPGTPGVRAAAPDAPVLDCDPRRPVPLAVGDHVAYAGMLQPDGPSGFIIAAHGLEAELGIYTAPGTEPVYVFVEEAIQGTKGTTFAGIPQEETTRFRIVGFSTDPSRAVEIRLIDSGRDETGTSISGPAGLTPSNGPQLGRFRNTWPAKDDARAVRRDVLVRVIGSPNERLDTTGLRSGLYVAPVNEYIYPEPTSFGVRGFPLPVPFENFCFLSVGGGTFETLQGQVTLERLDPFPESGHAESQQVGTGTRRVCDGP